MHWTSTGVRTDERTSNAELLVSSQYIADMHNTAEVVGSTRMDAIVSRWEALSLDTAGGRGVV